MYLQRHISRAFTYLLALALAVPALGFSGTAHAAQLQGQSLAIASSAASAVTTHEYSFTLPTNSNVGSFAFEYCTTPFPETTCIAPPGLDASGAILNLQSGVTGFSVDSVNTSANRIVIERSAAAVVTPASVLYQFDDIVNPSVADNTYYARIASYSSSDGTGQSIDVGSVAFSTSGFLGVGGFVPPHITFCVGITVHPSCQSTNDNLVSLGTLDESTTRTGTSQFAVATNDDGGYNVRFLGNTLTSGNKTIPPMTSSGSSSTGTSQFGINLRQNSQLSIGQEVSGVGSGQPAANYAGANQYRFVSGEVIASSSLPTDFNRFTVSYIANVDAAQDVGVYTTTIQYIATAQF